MSFKIDVSDKEASDRITSMLKGEKTYSSYYKNTDYTNRNNYSARYNPNLTNKSDSGSISKGHIIIKSGSGSGSGSSQSRSGPSISGFGIF